MARVDSHEWFVMEVQSRTGLYLVRVKRRKSDGHTTIEKVTPIDGARKVGRRSETYKCIKALVQQHLGPLTENPWEHIGGGCMVGPWAEGKRYPCDDDFEETKTGEIINIRTSREGHFNLPTRYGGKAKTVKEIVDYPGVKKGSRRQVKKPTKKRGSKRTKNPSVSALVRKALR